MAAIPAPMKRLPTKACESPILRRLKTKSATPDAKIAATSETSTVGQSYCTGIGRWKASIPM
jgi:hypothetical protein